LQRSADLRILGDHPFVCSGPPLSEQDEAERRANDCLAKAAYCKWLASISTNYWKHYYTRLADEWRQEAVAPRHMLGNSENGNPTGNRCL
jgi:hypothetical protein